MSKMPSTKNYGPKATIKRKRHYQQNMSFQRRIGHRMRGVEPMDVSPSSSSVCPPNLPPKKSTLLESNERLSVAEMRELRRLASLLPPHLRPPNGNCRQNSVQLVVTNAAKYISHLSTILIARSKKGTISKESFVQLPSSSFSLSPAECPSKMATDGKKRRRIKIDVNQNQQQQE